MPDSSRLSSYIKSMNDKIMQCCQNKPHYLIEYETGESHKICKKCFKKSYWNKYIKSKKIIDPKEPLTANQQHTTMNEAENIA